MTAKPPAPDALLKPGPDGLLTRDQLTEERIELYRQAAKAMGVEASFLDEETRKANRRQVLAVRPPGPLWIFGYGSLMWNPAFHFEERRPVKVHGWHRSFCLTLSMGRGSPDCPGLMLALDRGGACCGIAFRIAEAAVEAETTILWRREMLSGAYVPRWVKGSDGGQEITALTFAINRKGPRYAGRLDPRAVTATIARAEGHLGTNRDYLFNTCRELERMGLDDGPMHRLEKAVKAYLCETEPSVKGEK